jgi:hypothetical protein
MKAGFLTSPRFCRVKGAEGANNGVFTTPADTAAGRMAYVDMDFQIDPSKYQGIYVPNAGVCLEDSGGSSMIKLFMCPESERQNVPLKYVSGNGAGTTDSISDSQTFVGVPIPIVTDFSQTLNQGPVTTLLRPVFVPAGYFLRASRWNTAAGNGGCMMLEFFYNFITDPCTEIEL